MAKWLAYPLEGIFSIRKKFKWKVYEVSFCVMSAIAQTQLVSVKRKEKGRHSGAAGSWSRALERHWRVTGLAGVPVHA